MEAKTKSSPKISKRVASTYLQNETQSLYILFLTVDSRQKKHSKLEKI